MPAFCGPTAGTGNLLVVSLELVHTAPLIETYCDAKANRPCHAPELMRIIHSRSRHAIARHVDLHLQRLEILHSECSQHGEGPFARPRTFFVRFSVGYDGGPFMTLICV